MTRSIGKNCFRTNQGTQRRLRLVIGLLRFCGPRDCERLITSRGPFSFAMNAATPEAFLTPTAVAERVGVSRVTVLAWIRSGELPATNIAADPQGERPRWGVLPSDLEEFLAARRANECAR